jgi:hypothetical protein
MHVHMLSLMFAFISKFEGEDNSILWLSFTQPKSIYICSSNSNFAGGQEVSVFTSFFALTLFFLLPLFQSVFSSYLDHKI